RERAGAPGDVLRRGSGHRRVPRGPPDPPHILTCMDLGSFGVWTSLRRIGENRAGEAARLVEELGLGTFGLGGSPRLPGVRPLLAATERLTVATGIVNVWQYKPAQLASEHAELAREFPDRLLVGLGIGHPEATIKYSKPVTTMRMF